MKVLQSIAELAALPGPLCVAIGVFDGVHLGHRAVLESALAEARRVGGTMVALTFDPHPARVLRPAAAPHLLTSTAHKLRLIEDLGCDYALKITFDHAFASQPPEVFIQEIVAAAKPLHMICVGRDWSFGRNRSGNVSLLRTMGAELDFRTNEIDFVTVDDQPVSSTRIRALIESGQFEGAKKLLGRTFTILGTVKPGAQLGRQIGFPTANVAAHSEQFPPNGVYAVKASLEGSPMRGVANIGVRPTIESDGERLLEVHLFDFSEECYSAEIEIEFLRYLRPERKFASLEELKNQIARDAEEARRS